MPTLDLIRHGEVEQRGLLLGRTDMALSPHGWAQFEKQTAHRHWSAMVSSPMRRARAPAAQLAARAGIPLAIDGDWSELDFGAWDGRDIAELRTDAVIAARLDALYYDADAPAPPQGESWHDLLTRVGRALTSLCERTDDDRVLIVTHGGPIRAVLSIASGISFSQTWAFRIDYATRIALRLGRDANGRPWGEIVEIVQP